MTEDPGSFSIHEWNYRWEKEHGSKNWSVKNPDREGEDPVEIASIRLSQDRRSVFLEILDHHPVMQMRIRYNLDAEDGELVKSEMCNTIYRVGDQPLPAGASGN